MQNTTDNEERTIPHQYLTLGNGQPLKFLRLTEEPCPVCNRGPKRTAMMALLHDGPTETVHCIACDHQETRPQKKSPKQRPMNSGK